jgi:hypothetical protein
MEAPRTGVGEARRTRRTCAGGPQSRPTPTGARSWAASSGGRTESAAPRELGFSAAPACHPGAALAGLGWRQGRRIGGDDYSTARPAVSANVPWWSSPGYASG